MSSYYRDCAQAIRELIADETEHARDHRGFFTDLDVAVLASEIAGGYNESQMQAVLTEANLALAKFYRSERVARFGPVHLPGIPQPDYARIATRIVYASANGPAKFETVNGNFKRLMHSKDKMTRRGRRGDIVNRDDREPWTLSEESKLRARLAELR